MRLSTKIAYNTIIQVASKFLTTLLGLASISIMTRYLGQVGFGQYTTIVTFVSFFAVVADLGLTLVTVQLISRPGADEKRILSNLFGLRLVTALVFLGFAPLVVLFFPYESVVKLGVGIVIFSFIFIALNQVMVGLFQKRLRMDRVSIAEVVGRLFLVLGVWTVFRYDYGLLGMVIATVLASVVSFMLHFYYSRNFVPIGLSFDFTYWREIISKSWPLAITIIFNLIYLRADILILSLIKTQAEVGIYGAAYKVIDVLVNVPFVFAGIILPIMTALWAKSDKEGFKNVLQKSFDAMVIVAIPIFVGTQAVANEVMIIVAGPEFVVSGPVLRILIAAASIIFFGIMFSHAVIALDKQKKIINAYVFTAVSSLVAYLIFIPRYSYFGAAWVTIYSEFFISLAAFYLVWRYSSFVPKLTVFFKSLVSAIIMGIALFILGTKISFSGANLLFVIFFGVVIYFLFIILFRTLSKEDLDSLLNKRQHG